MALIRGLVSHVAGMPLSEAIRKYGRGVISGISRSIKAGEEYKKP